MPEQTIHDKVVTIVSMLKTAVDGKADASAIPAVPEISTDISADASSDAKTASPHAVKTFVEAKGYVTSATSPVGSVNGKTGAVSLSAGDVSALPALYSGDGWWEVGTATGASLSVNGGIDVAGPFEFESDGVFDGGVYAGSVSADIAYLENAWAYTLGNYDGGAGLLVPSGAYPGDSVARTSDLASLSMGGYAFVTPQVTFSATDAENDTALFSLSNLSVNAAAFGDGVDYVEVTFPPKDQTFARDFFLRLTLSGSDVPTITFREPDNSDLNFDADDSSWADIARGVNLLMFTETAR